MVGISSFDEISEKERLEEISRKSIYAHGVSAFTIPYCCHIFRRSLIKGNILELGPAEGLMTDILYPLYPDGYTVVDGSNIFINQLKQRYPAINASVSLFEKYNPVIQFDNIILGHVLEHVVDPIAILTLCKSWLKYNGLIFAAVPNRNSIHRQAAVKMGLLSGLEDFSEKDKRHGHRRVFGRHSLVECFNTANLSVVESGGYWLKPLSDIQIENNWTRQMIDAFLYLGELYPDIAGEIYIIAATHANIV
jgi:2-polyprenyl-3-methyl-5-hydroxy-6-metoxy-1,4-benzoquinol methylase